MEHSSPDTKLTNDLFESNWAIFLNWPLDDSGHVVRTSVQNYKWRSLLKIEVLVSEKNLKVYLKLIFAPHPFWAKWENQRSEKLNIGCTPHGINFARSKYYTFLDENLFNSPVHSPDKKIIHWFVIHWFRHISLVWLNENYYVTLKLEHISTLVLFVSNEPRVDNLICDMWHNMWQVIYETWNVIAKQNKSCYETWETMIS